MATQIECSYRDCQRRFPDLKAMKKHKANDKVHEFYCKRCDEDCIDDTVFFFHQITSPRHACCPVCGREFKSEGGRDRHVEIDHPTKQKLNCVGCNNFFESASSLMHHIENDECQVIKRAHFYSQRAERQIAVDSWQTATNMHINAGNAFSDVLDEVPEIDESALLVVDELKSDGRDGAWSDTDWQGVPVHASGAGIATSQKEYKSSKSSILSTNSFPPLTSQHSQATDGNSDAGAPLYDLLDFGQEAQTWNSREHGREAATKYTHKKLHAQDMTSSIVFPQGLSQLSIEDHVTTATQVSLTPHLEMNKYYDAISETYTCPGSKCKQKFQTLPLFKTHLLSPAHNPGLVRCPGCLKQFKTTTALIAHCESASRKCKIRDSFDFNMVIKQITAGMIAADGYQDDGSVKYTAQKIEDW